VATLAGLARLQATNLLGLPPPDWLWPRPDVFHASQLLARRPRRSKLTATLHDLSCWLLPETHTPANVRSARRFAECIVPAAAGLIAISHSTRADAVRLLRIPEENIQVIYQGVAEQFFHVTPESIQTACRRYKLRRPYALFVGTIEPRKNLASLIEAWLALPGELRSEYELIVAGPAGWGEHQLLERLRAGIAGVRYLGYVPESDLPGLTAGATLLAYPSLYEGFGLPVAQAMAAGVPVLTSAVSSLPEVAGDAAVLVDPRSVFELREGLKRLLSSEALRAKLSAQGTERARRFSWQRCARESLEFFERVAGGG